VNILAMLARLEAALRHSNLSRQMILLPDASPSDVTALSDINLVVAYNGSPRSQTALDLTLWIAHQTRLANSKPVNVQVVYVVSAETLQKPNRPQFFNLPPQRQNRRSKAIAVEDIGKLSLSRCLSTGTAIAEPGAATSFDLVTPTSQIEQFERADHILWQARTLAEEWRGSLKTHLRFGSIAQELHRVIISEAASLLVVGCESMNHPLIDQLQAKLPCPVLGIPPVSQSAS